MDWVDFARLQRRVAHWREGETWERRPYETADLIGDLLGALEEEFYGKIPKPHVRHELDRIECVAATCEGLAGTLIRQSTRRLRLMT